MKIQFWEDLCRGTSLLIYYHFNILWKETKDEKFSVKSLYSALEPRSAVPFPRNIIWSPCVPTQMDFFAWEATWGNVLTLDQLKRRGWSIANRCLLCCAEEESINHILIHCTKTRVLWELLFASFGVTWIFWLEIPSLVGMVPLWARSVEGLDDNSIMFILVGLEGKKYDCF